MDGTFLRPFRYPLYCLFGAAGFGALYFVPQHQPGSVLAAALGGFAAAFILLRQWQFALAAILVPLPAILWLGASAYALELALAILMTSAYEAALRRGSDPLAALGAILAALAGVLLFALLWSLHTPVQLAALLASSAVTGWSLPALAMSLAVSEDTIMRGNRAEESWRHLCGFAHFLAEPRWSLALAAAGLVLAVLGYFQAAMRPPRFDWLALIIVAAIFAAMSRNPRQALAAAGAGALLLLFSGGVNGSLLLYLLFAMVLGAAAAQAQDRGERAPAAWGRVLEDHWAVIFFAGLAAVAAAWARSGIVPAWHAGFGLLAALILFPALAGALEHLFPPRRSVEELYG